MTARERTERARGELAAVRGQRRQLDLRAAFLEGQIDVLASLEDVADDAADAPMSLMAAKAVKSG